jgi:Cof subfamily protein (haloacid dehalogenase superfamily)
MSSMPEQSGDPLACGVLPQSPAPAASATSIRLVAIDLDGTLLDDCKQVSEQTVEALLCLPAQGIRTVIASARPPRSVRHIYHRLALDTWTINYNGALIWDEVTKRVVYHQPMESDVVLEIIRRSRRIFDQLLVGCEVLDRWFTDRDEHAYTTETGRLFRPDGVMPIDQFCNQPITKLLLLGEPARLKTIEPVFYDYPQVSAVRADPELIQVMDRRASKAAALRVVASHYGVPMRQVMAIGDAVNDVAMLQEAGIAVAMDNAHPLVKQVADWVAPSNNDHGVHAALMRYGLCT